MRRFWCFFFLFFSYFIIYPMEPIRDENLPKEVRRKVDFNGSCEGVGCVSIALCSILSCLPGANLFSATWVSGLIWGGLMGDEPECYSCLLNRWRNSQIPNEKME